MPTAVMLMDSINNSLVNRPGVVPIASQIPMKRQLEATRLVGFNNSHVGTLQDSSFIDLLRDFLQEGVDDVGAGSRSN